MSPEESDTVNTDSKLVNMGCACQGGYTGRFCDSDIDACESNGQPCLQELSALIFHRQPMPVGINVDPVHQDILEMVLSVWVSLQD